MQNGSAKMWQSRILNKIAHHKFINAFTIHGGQQKRIATNLKYLYGWKLKNLYFVYEYLPHQLKIY